MATEIYREALENAQQELEAAIRERDRWTLEVAKLQQLVNSLMTRVPTVSDEEKETLKAFKEAVKSEVGLQEVVLTCIRSASEPISATEIRDRIRLGQLADLSRYSNSLAVIHNALKRLLKNKQIKYVPGKRFVVIPPYQERAAKTLKRMEQKYGDRGEV